MRENKIGSFISQVQGSTYLISVSLWQGACSYKQFLALTLEWTLRYLLGLHSHYNSSIHSHRGNTLVQIKPISFPFWQHTQEARKAVWFSFSLVLFPFPLTPLISHSQVPRKYLFLHKYSPYQFLFLSLSLLPLPLSLSLPPPSLSDPCKHLNQILPPCFLRSSNRKHYMLLVLVKCGH